MAEQSTHVSHPRLGDPSPHGEGARRPSADDPLKSSPPASSPDGSSTGKSSAGGSDAPGTPRASESGASSVSSAAGADPGNEAGKGSEADAGNGNGSGLLVSPEQQPTVISRNRPEGSSGTPLPSNPREMAVVLEGQRLGHFELGQFVGGGGMGAVFRATDTMLGRTVAVKILSRNHTDEEIIRRFQNEAQSAARLDHPNIARVYYVGEDQGWNYIVFEFIEGENIRDRVERVGPLSLEDAFSYTLQIAEALEHACSRDVVHRDIKPSNVLVMPDGRAKLVDMGLARLHQVEAADNDLTASGVTLGTFDYISPEQARDPRSADVRSDLYSLGCTMYYMLTGRPPFAGTAIKKLLSHAGDAPPDVRQFRPDVPDEVVAVINKMMAKRPEGRYQKPSELIGELLLLAEHLGLRGAAQGGTVWITRRHSRWDRYAPVLVTAVSIALLVGSVLGLEHFLAQNDTKQDFVAAPQHLEEPVSDSTPGEAASEDTALPAEESNTTETVEGANSTVDAAGETPETDAASPSGPSEAAAAVRVAEDTAEFQQDDPAADFLDEILAPPAAGITLAEASGPLTVPPPAGEFAFLNAAGDSPDAVLSAVAAVDAAEPAVVAEETLPELIVVGDDPGDAPETTLFAGSFKEALRTSAEQPSVHEIVLPAGEYDVEAVFINGQNRPKLTIRSDGGDAPLLRFQPVGDGFGLLPTQMISLSGGQEVVFQGVHFRLELPAEEDEQWSERWSLFHVQNLSSLTFENCALTIQNASQDGGRLHEKVAFVQVEPPSEFYLTLENCIARGQATLVRAETSTPFTVKWNQGLFVSTERLIEAGGTADEPGNGRIAVTLDHLTAVSPKGLCLLKTSPDKNHQFILGVEYHNSIILIDPESPLLARFGPETPEEAIKKKLEVVAAGNFYYPQEPVFCRVGEDAQQAVDYTFDQAIDEFPGVSQLPDESVMWDVAPALDAVAHQQRKQDFKLSTTPHRALDKKAGFDPDLLPELPAPPPAPPKESSSSAVPMSSREMPVMPAMPEMPSPSGTSQPDSPDAASPVD
jgi:serine/threonine protein kinase